MNSGRPQDNLKLTRQRACHAVVLWKLHRLTDAQTFFAHYAKLKGKPPDTPLAVVNKLSP